MTAGDTVLMQNLHDITLIAHFNTLSIKQLTCNLECYNFTKYQCT